MNSEMAVVFPVTFKVGDRMVVPSGECSSHELVVVCKREIRFDSVEEFYDHCSTDIVSSHFAYALRARPN